MPPDEKRSAPRIQPFVVACHLLVGERRLAGYVTDLSLHGAQVTGGEDMPEGGEAVVLEVRFPPGLKRYRLPGLVRWARAAAGGQVCGLTFEALAPAERSALEEVIEQVRRRAAALG